MEDVYFLLACYNFNNYLDTCRKKDIKMRKWAVYFPNSEGHREGTEYIWATTKQEAIETYKRYFNVKCACIAIPVFPGFKEKIK